MLSDATSYSANGLSRAVTDGRRERTSHRERTLTLAAVPKASVRCKEAPIQTAEQQMRTTSSPEGGKRWIHATWVLRRRRRPLKGNRGEAAPPKTATLMHKGKEKEPKGGMMSAGMDGENADILQSQRTGECSA